MAWMLAAALAGALLAWALLPSGAAGQEYELPAPPPPPPPAALPLDLVTPFPIVRIVGRVTKRGAKITRLTVRAAAGNLVISECRASGRRCPYPQRISRIPGSSGQVRVVHVRGFERTFRAGVVLRVFVTAPARMGKFASFTIRRNRPPRRRDRCVAALALRPVRCPWG